MHVLLFLVVLEQWCSTFLALWVKMSGVGLDWALSNPLTCPVCWDWVLGTWHCPKRTGLKSQGPCTILSCLPQQDWALGPSAALFQPCTLGLGTKSCAQGLGLPWGLKMWRGAVAWYHRPLLF